MTLKHDEKRIMFSTTETSKYLLFTLNIYGFEINENIDY